MLRPDPFAVRALLGPHASPGRRAVTGEAGVALPPFHDHHVHVHLIDLAAVATGGIAAVLDLGGVPADLARRPRTGMPRVAYAGAFLTAAGGYPSGRSWAPSGSVHEITRIGAVGEAGGADTAVDEQATFGASVIKVTLNAAAGPVFDAVTLRGIVDRAHEHGLPVVAHVEGAGMSRLALEAGIDALAHAPFTEELDPASIAGAVAAGQRWISTLDIHRGTPGDRDRAIANVSAFAAAGGMVLYGTDLGNGDLPAGVNERELSALAAAGLDGPAIIEALADPWPWPDALAGVCTFVAGAPPADGRAIPAWLAGARVVPAEELIHDEP